MNPDMLRHALLHEIAYPAQMRAVDRGINGLGFYPGANGYKGDRFPRSGIMLLGRDFGTEDYYGRLVGPRSETALTWRHTRDLYLQNLNGIPVWCTNYLMGVRRNGSAKGNVQAQVTNADWIAYEGSCWKFFLKQFALQQPLVIGVFGEFNEVDLRRESRLESAAFAPVTKLYLKHPHSAIGEANRAAHIRQAAILRAAYLQCVPRAV